MLRTLENIANSADERNEMILERLTQEAEEVAKQLAPVKTGYLRENIMPEQIEYGREWKLISYAPYSIFQEFGFNHYRDGFIPGRFFMSGAKDSVDNIIDSGELANTVITSIAAQVEPATEDAQLF